jgi:hypothetical protein
MDTRTTNTHTQTVLLAIGMVFHEVRGEGIRHYTSRNIDSRIQPGQLCRHGAGVNSGEDGGIRG